MTKSKLFIFLATLLVVGILATLISFYARGYRLDPDNLRFSPNGLFVIKSVPGGASVYLNGELKTATNATLTLIPGTYDVSVRKDGYITWNKRILIDKE